MLSQIFREACQGVKMKAEVGQWLSEYILDNKEGGLNLLWHGLDVDTTRPLKLATEVAPFQKDTDRGLYADGHACMLLSMESVEGLNSKLREAGVDLITEERRFRPNIVVRGE